MPTVARVPSVVGHPCRKDVAAPSSVTVWKRLEADVEVPLAPRAQNSRTARAARERRAQLRVGRGTRRPSPPRARRFGVPHRRHRGDAGAGARYGQQRGGRASAAAILKVLHVNGSG